MKIDNPETIQDILINATRALCVTMEFHDARLQAELLLAYALNTSRSMVLARLNEVILPQVAAQYAANVARRVQREPLVYILGHQEFFGLDFLVDRRVLIPRHETETLVALALECARKISAPIIVDVGTGSGALALTLAQHLAQARVFALDISRGALDVAKLNAERLGLTPRVEFLQSDLLDGLTERFDLLVANLPYIPTPRMAQLPDEVRAFEPQRALDGGEDGLVVFRRLLAQLPMHTNHGAIVLLEISEEQGQAAMEAVQQILLRAFVALHQDLEEMDRVVEIKLAKEK